ncbi:A kinase (PRKA) anchor protein 11 [Apodemus speciosus]|uniref:A kinase (PRKA) anchor protein 11 n=1 Tax=Apodemus speciosus TaxID=105296 RepID=A0ABQ0FIU9_APOSI
MCFVDLLSNSLTSFSNTAMAAFQPLRNSHGRNKASVRKSFSEDVFQSVKSLLQSEKELCSVSGGECLNQDEHAQLTEVTFLGFNEETDAAHMQVLSENEIICMKDTNKSSDVSSCPLNQSHHSGMLCVMRVSPTLPGLRIDFIFSLLSKYAAGIRHTLDMHLHQKHHLETTDEDDDDTNQSVSSIEDDFVTAFEQLEEEENAKLYNDEINIASLRSRCDATSQTTSGHHLESHDFKVLVSYGSPRSLAKPPPSVNVPGRKEAASVKTSVTTSVSEPWTQRSLYRSPSASDKGKDPQETVFPSSPAHSSESECSSPSPVIFLDEEGYQKSLKAKLELPEIPVTKDDVEDSDSEVREFFDSFDQFDELDQTLETCPFMEDPVIEKSSQKIGHKYEKSCMNPQKFKFERPALPANVRKPTPRKPESPYSHLCDAPDSPRPVMASEDSGLFSPIRTSAFSPPGSCTPAECFCQTDSSESRIHGNYCTYEDYANSLSCEVLGSVLHTQHANTMSDINSIKKGGNNTVTFKHGDSDQKSKCKTSSVITDSVQKFAADLVGKSFGSAFKDLQKGVSSCTNALCHLAVKLTSSVFQMAFNELRRQCAFSLKERAIGSLASLLVNEALSNALKDLQYVKKQMFTNTVARFAADLAEELVFEGIMEVCQFSCPQTPASLQCQSFDFEDKVVKSYAKDLSESVIQEAFIELSQTDVTFTTKAAVNVSMGNVKYVSAESVVSPTQTFTMSSSFSSQALMTKPVQEHKKEYTVQQALFCTSGIVTSIPVPLAGSALLPYHMSSTLYQSKSPSSEHSKANGGSTQEHIVIESSEEEVDCLRNTCLPSELKPCIQNDFRPTNGDISMQGPSKLMSGPVIISNFSAAMVHTIVNETLESMTSFKATKAVNTNADYLTKTIKGKACSLSLCDQAAAQQNKSSSKDMFAEQLSKSIIKQSLGKSKSMLPNIDKNPGSKEHMLVLGEESQLTLGETPKFLDFSDNSPHRSLLFGNYCVPDCKDSVGLGSSLETLPPCSMMTSQKYDLKEVVKDKAGTRHNLNNTALEPLSFGQESLLRHSQTLSSAVLTCVDSLHVEDKQKIRDRNVIPDTPPSTPLVPSQTSSEWDIKKLTKQLKGELAKEFAPATPPSTPHNSSVGSLSENEQTTIEKEEFMLKLMRSLSEEVESSEGEEHPEMDVKSEYSGKKVQFAEALATHIISLATEVAASHLDHEITQEFKIKNAHLNVPSQRNVPALRYPEENIQTCAFASDMAADVIAEAEKIANARSCMLFRHERNICHVDGDQGKAEEKLHVEDVSRPREVETCVLSLPSGMPGLTYKYPSCESVTDEYAGHVIQVLKQEGGNGELIMDQYASRMAYRSVKSGVQEAAKTATMKCGSKLFPLHGSHVKTNEELLVFPSKEHHQEADRQRKRNGSHPCRYQTCERTKDPCRNERSELHSFSASLASSIARDVKKQLTAPKVDLPKSSTDGYLFEYSECVDLSESVTGPEFSKSCQPLQNHGCCQDIGSLGSLSGYSRGENSQAVEQYARKVVNDTLEISLGSTVFHNSEVTTSADRITYTEKLSPLINEACRYCDLKEFRGCTRNSAQIFSKQNPCGSAKPSSHSKFSSSRQKSRIFHLDVPQIHVNLDKRAVLAEKIVAEAIEKAERELSNTSMAADSGIGQDGISFAESLSTEIMTTAVTNAGHAASGSSSKEIEDFQSPESFGSQQMNLSVGEDSTGSWSNLSFEDDHQDESSSFHHLSESNDSDGPDDRDDEQEDGVEDLQHNGKTLLIMNIDMEPGAVDSQLRLILQWLIASEAGVAELYFQDSAKKEFILLSKRLQEKGWKVGDVLQAVLKYYEVVEQASREERCKSLFDWLLENA